MATQLIAGNNASTGNSILIQGGTTTAGPGGIINITAGSGTTTGGHINLTVGNGSSGGSIQLFPSSTGPVELRFYNSAAANYVGMKCNTTLSGNTIWTMPTADGSNGFVLQTNGSAITTFATPTPMNVLGGPGQTTSSVTNPLTGINFFQDDGQNYIYQSGVWNQVKNICLPGTYSSIYTAGQNITVGQIVSMGSNGTVVSPSSGFQAVANVIVSGLNTTGGTFTNGAIDIDQSSGDFYIASEFSGTIVVTNTVTINTYTYVATSSSNIIVMKINSSGIIQWSCRVTSNNGVVLARPGCKYFNNRLYVSFTGFTQDTFTTITWFNGDNTVGQTSAPAVTPACLGSINTTTAVWQAIPIIITSNVGSGYECEVGAGSLVINTSTSKLYMGGSRGVGFFASGGLAANTLFIDNLGTINVPNDLATSDATGRFRYWYLEVDLIAFRINWVNSPQQVAPDRRGSFVTDIVLDSANNIYVSAISHSFGTGSSVFWTNYYTSGGSFVLPSPISFGGAVSVIFRINVGTTTGDRNWLRYISNNNNSGSALITSGTRLWAQVYSATGTSNDYSDTFTIEWTIPAFGSANAIVFEINSATGVATQSTLHRWTGTGIATSTDIIPHFSFSALNGTLVITAPAINGGIISYRDAASTILNTLTMTTNRLITILDLNLNIIIVDSISDLLSNDIQNFKTGIGYYGAVDKGFSQNNVNSPNGGIVLFAIGSLPIQGIAISAATIGNPLCVAWNGNYTYGSNIFTTGTKYYYNTVTGALSSTYMANAQVGTAVSTNTIDIRTIDQDLTGQYNGTSGSFSTNVSVVGTTSTAVLSVERIIPKTGLTIEYQNVQYEYFNNNSIPSATFMNFSNVISASTVAAALGGAGFTKLTGANTTTINPAVTAGSNVLFDFQDLINRIDTGGTSPTNKISVYKFKFEVGSESSDTAFALIASYDINFTIQAQSTTSGFVYGTPTSANNIITYSDIFTGVNVGDALYLQVTAGPPRLFRIIYYANPAITAYVRRVFIKGTCIASGGTT